MKVPFSTTLDRIKIYVDGDEWCALYGENLQEGKAAFAPREILERISYHKDAGRFKALDRLRREHPELRFVPYIVLKN